MVSNILRDCPGGGMYTTIKQLNFGDKLFSFKSGFLHTLLYCLIQVNNQPASKLNEIKSKSCSYIWFTLLRQQKCPPYRHIKHQQGKSIFIQNEGEGISKVAHQRVLVLTRKARIVSQLEQIDKFIWNQLTCRTCNQWHSLYWCSFCVWDRGFFYFSCILLFFGFKNDPHHHCLGFLWIMLDRKMS